MELTGNTILITGGTSGFGLEFAAQLISMGNTVIVTGRDQAKLVVTRKKLPHVHTIQSDVSDPKAIVVLHEQVLRDFPAMNILINNAGEMRKISLHDTSIDLLDITREVEINLMGPIRMVQQFLPHLKTKASAAILNVTSGLALVPFPLSPVYGATKSGLRSYTQSLRVQLKKTKIRVFELLAPASNTPLGDKFMNVQNFDPKVLMEPAKIVNVAIKAMQKDKFEIYLGLSVLFRILSRVAPSLALAQTSKVGADIMYQ